MGHPKIVAALCALLLLTGCASVRWSLKKSLREEGAVNTAFPEIVWQEYECDEKDLPFVKLEKHELVPPRVKPGGEFNHRMVYSMCPVRSTGVITGRLNTRIRFRGEPIYRDSIDAYELRPGRWKVDTFVELPPRAAPGVYAYEIEFESREFRFEKSLTFITSEP